MLHGAPALLATILAGPHPDRLQLRGGVGLRRVSRSCCGAVDAAAVRIRLDFGCPAASMARRMAKAPHLAELTCVFPSGEELEQLLAGAAAARPSPVAGVQRLEVLGSSSARQPQCSAAPPGAFCPGGLPALPRSLAHLPNLQVRAVGLTAAWAPACEGCITQASAMGGAPGPPRGIERK